MIFSAQRVGIHAVFFSPRGIIFSGVLNLSIATALSSHGNHWPRRSFLFLDPCRCAAMSRYGLQLVVSDIRDNNGSTDDAYRFLDALPYRCSVGRGLCDVF